MDSTTIRYRRLRHPLDYLSDLDLNDPDSVAYYIYEELDCDARSGWSTFLIDSLVDDGVIAEEMADEIIQLGNRVVSMIDKRLDAGRISKNSEWRGIMDTARRIRKQIPVDLE